jgi:hypothetical protein
LINFKKDAHFYDTSSKADCSLDSSDDFRLETPKFIIDLFEKCKRDNKESRVGFGDVKSFSIFKCII